MDAIKWVDRTDKGIPVNYYSLARDGERVVLTEKPAVSESRPASMLADNGMADRRWYSPDEARKRLGHVDGVPEALDTWFPQVGA